MAYRQNPLYHGTDIGQSINELARTILLPDTDGPLAEARVRKDLAAADNYQSDADERRRKAQGVESLSGLMGGAGQWANGSPPADWIGQVASGAVAAGYDPKDLGEMVRFVTSNMGAPDATVHRAVVGAGGMPNADTVLTTGDRDFRRQQLQQNALQLQGMRNMGDIAVQDMRGQQDMANPTMQQALGKAFMDLYQSGRISLDELKAATGVQHTPEMETVTLPNGQTARIDKFNPNAPVLPSVGRIDGAAGPQVGPINYSTPEMAAKTPAEMRSMQIMADRLGVSVEDLMLKEQFEAALRAIGINGGAEISPELVKQYQDVTARIAAGGMRRVAAPPPGSTPVR